MVKRLKRVSAIWLAVIMAVTLVMPMAAAGEYTELELGIHRGTETLEVGGFYPAIWSSSMHVYGNDAQIEVNGTDVKENTVLGDTSLDGAIDYIENTGRTITGWTLWGGYYESGFVCEAELGEVDADPTIGDIMALTANKNYDVYVLEPIADPFAITHQPTTDEPYVLVNNTKTASYQWYGRDPEADPIPVAVTDSGQYFYAKYAGNYDSADGVWKNDHAGFTNTGNGVDISIGDLNDGDIITVTVVEGDADKISVYDYNGNIVFVSSGDKTVWTGICDDTDGIENPMIEALQGSNFAVTIEVTSDGYSELSGETESRISSLKEGYEYYCRVEWKYGGNIFASEISNSFIYEGDDEDGDRRNFWPWLLLLTRAVRYYDGEELLHTARVWKENPLEAVYEPEAREGYTFAGWYTDTEYTETFDFTEPLLASHRVYAKWVPSTEGNIEQ